MESELERLELEPLLARDDNLAAQYAALPELRLQGIDYLREITIERLPVAALDENLVTVAEDEGAKAVPLRLEYPSFTGWQLTNSLCEHWEDRRIDSEVHVPDGLKMSVQSWIHNRYRVAGGRNCAVARLESQKAARLRSEERR